MNKFLTAMLLFSLIMPETQALEYDYSSTKSIPVKLQINNRISTRGNIFEGQKINFTVSEDVYDGEQIILEKGQQVTGTVETIITSGMNGFPAEIIVDHFEIPNVKDTQLVDEYIKIGQNRCIWVYPLKWALTILPPSGSLTNFIKGGHAVIKPTDKIVIYYYPEWK